MPFIPHTPTDIAAMLQEIGVDSLDKLFEEIPSELQMRDWPEIPDGLNEMVLGRLMQSLAAKDVVGLNFIGAGAYQHHIPAVVWDIATRGEWMTSYTPYQAEASQGTLQLLYEYQTMMTNLMCMEVSNASMYDGASALAEAILMAVRCQPHLKVHRILLPTTIHPLFRQVVKTLVKAKHIEIIEVSYCPKTGKILLDSLNQYEGQELSAVVLSQPNFFGVLEDVDELSNWAHQAGAYVIGVVNPLSVGLLNPPGKWGKKGVDIVCGDGQPLGIPLASGGPYFGFLCCQKKDIRQLPGRLVGRTIDQTGQTGFTLTLQAREQHIRRSKATSNICTNQGLLVTAATIYMSLLGAEGLGKVATLSHANADFLLQQLTGIKGVTRLFNSPFFHEVVIKLPVPVSSVLQSFFKHGIEPGFVLSEYYPELGDCLLICATETKLKEDMIEFTLAMKDAIEEVRS